MHGGAVQRRVHRGKWHAQWVFGNPALASVRRQCAGLNGETACGLSSSTDPVGAALRTFDNLKSRDVGMAGSGCEPKSEAGRYLPLGRIKAHVPG